MASQFAGKNAPLDLLINVKALLEAYYTKTPEITLAEQKVSFGTSGHRGTSLNASFNEAHILAVTQAVCDYRKKVGITGPLFIGMDTHALSAPAHRTAIEVLAANGVETMRHLADKVTPTPVISYSILTHNLRSSGAKADGIVITPSHNPPEDGGFKYNPPHGGPADTDVTSWIEARANDLIASGLKEVKRLPYEKAIKTSCIHEHDFITPYVNDLSNVLDMELIKASGLKLGADALGGSAAPFWVAIAEKYTLNMTVLNAISDPQFSFMRVDKDGKIRMDCSSAAAMAGLIEHSSKYDLAFANDPDADRHGIVTPKGLMSPNHYLAVAVQYLYSNRPAWPAAASIGKTVVTSIMLDKVAAGLGRSCFEVPVGFKWFVEPLMSASCAFGGEESAGASFLRKDGSVWSTDKDGLIMGLLAAEMTAKTGKTPADIYEGLEAKFGKSYYTRVDAPANAAQKSILKKLTPENVQAKTLAGEAITGIYTNAPGNNAPIGGLKVGTENGWFAARPSGTEEIYKIYAESLKGTEHLELLLAEAKGLVNTALASAR